MIGGICEGILTRTQMYNREALVTLGYGDNRGRDPGCEILGIPFLKYLVPVTGGEVLIQGSCVFGS